MDKVLSQGRGDSISGRDSEDRSTPEPQAVVSHPLAAGAGFGALLQLIDELFSYPAITNPAVSERMKITPRSSQLNIDKLVQKGILREATGRQRNRVYVATEIVDIIERQETGAPEVHS